MGKGKKKKKHALKEEVSEDVLDAAALSVRKFRKVTKEIGKLSTAQKVVGGLALLAAGLTYLAKLDLGSDDQSADKKPEKTEDKKAAEIPPSPEFARLVADDSPAEPLDSPSKPSATRKHRKPSKPKHES